MAKALLGYVGSTADPQLLAETETLRRRLRELSDELAATRRELTARDALIAELRAREESISLEADDLVRLHDLSHASI